jgi:acetyl-CoA carboxylase biotin carboxyl carrier protein
VEYKEIIDLMQEMTKTGLTRIKIEQDDFKLELEKNIVISKSMQTVQTPDSTQGKENFIMSDNMANDATANDATANDNKANAAMADVAIDKEVPGTKRILSPMVGTFYCQPAPDKPSFISVGDLVKRGQTVCIIEAMKLMNEIESDVEGEVIKCLVENEDMVEFGQPLFIVK